MQKIKKDFTLMAILLIPIAVAINVVCGEIVTLLKLPLFLNSIGTLIVAMIAGPWVGLLTGGLTNVIQGMFNPTSFPFAIVNMAIGFTAGYLSQKGMMNKIWKVIISGVIIAMITIITAAPIVVLMFGGASGTGSDTFTAVLLASGQEIWTAVFTQKIFVESFDKILSVVIAFWIVKRMSARYLSKQKHGSLYIDKNEAV